MYAGDDEADTLLAIAEQVFQANPDAFKDRAISSIPLKVGDGLAIGDEPKAGKGSSLTSHRAAVLEETLAKVREGNPATNEQKVKLFRGLWHSTALQAGINPDNIAFNARKTK